MKKFIHLKSVDSSTSGNEFIALVDDINSITIGEKLNTYKIQWKGHSECYENYVITGITKREKSQVEEEKYAALNEVLKLEGKITPNGCDITNRKIGAFLNIEEIDNNLDTPSILAWGTKAMALKNLFNYLED